jgi:cell division transport system permease protein
LSRFTARLRYFVADAADEWKHSPGVNLLATGTLAAVLFLAGLVLLVVSNLEKHLEQVRRDLRVEVYLADRIAPEQQDSLERKLLDMPGVSRVEYVDKEQALQRYREWSSDLADLVTELGHNPLPASFEVYMESESVAGDLAARIAGGFSGEQGVEEVRYDRDWIDRAEAYLGLVRAGGFLLASIVFGAVVFVIASVLRLAVYARRDEIEIMLLVGATPGFVRGPFLVAGVSQGLVASLVAVGMVEGVRHGVLAFTGARTGVLLSLVAARPLGWAPTAVTILCGLAVGFIGSWFAVRGDRYDRS